MSQPFPCNCGHPTKCLGYISGAKDIPADKLKEYFVNDHIATLKKQEQ